MNSRGSTPVPKVPWFEMFVSQYYKSPRSKNDLITIFRPKSSKLSMKSYVLAFSHIPCNKIGQSQPKVNI